MSEKERIENLIKAVEMLDDSMKFYELIRRLHKSFLSILMNFVAENELKGGDKGEENLQ